MAIQIPVGVGPPHLADAFRGMIDLVTMEYLTFAGCKPGSRSRPLADSARGGRHEAELWREELLGKLFEYSNELAELVLEEAAGPGRADPPRACARRRCIG